MNYCLSVFLLLALFNLSAQPRLVFDKTLHDFGKVNERDGPVSYRFIFKNAGTTPLIISDVQASCDCTVPEWTTQPVPPGETGFVSVSYDVVGRPGAINKMIIVFSNSQPATAELRITGEVVLVEKHPREFCLFTVGTIRLNNLQVAFNRVYSNEKSTLTVTAYNPGADAVKISFVDLPEHIQTEVIPAMVGGGETARITVSYDAEKKNDWDFVYDHIRLILNDDKSKEYHLTVTATIQEDFSLWTEDQLQRAPAMSIDRMLIDAGEIKKGETVTIGVKMTNNGKSKLVIRKIDAGQLTVQTPKEIEAGDTVDLTITYDSSGQIGEQYRSIHLITNDPKKSKITLRFRVEVIDS